MKIEKISENQIRCTLNPQDLQERNLKLSEFAYGSGKAKELFRDMMEKASEEYDFEVDNSPLVVEAIPTSAESLILIITKVDNPEELDTRFSTFTPGEEEADEDTEEESSEEESYTGFPELPQLENAVLSKLRKHLAEIAETIAQKKAQELPPDALTMNAFRFNGFGNLTAFARSVKNGYDGHVTLYHDAKERCYYLCVYLDGMSTTDYNRICNTACEYASIQPAANALFYQEHYSCVMDGMDVIAELAAI